MKKRLFLILSSLAVWYVAYFHFKPWFVQIATPILSGTKHTLLFNHMFIFSFPVALMCGLWWVILIYKKLLPAPLIFANFKTAIQSSTRTGLGITLVTVAFLVLVFKVPAQFHFNGQAFFGNIFSNTWEEIIYRGLLFQAFAVALGHWIPGALISSAIFAYTHDQYPFDLQVFVGFIGFALATSFQSTKNFLSPVWAHVLVDWIADLFF